jgi:predicted AlkP superfamily pyrophosphatase or phosphodiesterase
MTGPTVFIIMDAGRDDYVTPDSMPFVHGLAQDSRQAKFESPPGFAQRTVLFSGRYPDTSNNFSAFVFDPDNSPFQWVKKLGSAGSVVRARRMLYPLRWGIDKATKALTGAYHTDPAWIPPQYLPFFRPCEDMRPMYEPQALGATSIFDLCRSHGKKFRYLAHPVSGDDDEIHSMLVRSLRKEKDIDLYVAQFSVTDEMGHHHGPHSNAMRRGFLRELDGKIASIHAALTASHEQWNLFLCGDHGMAPVREEVNARALLESADAVAGEDYVLFVNSTLLVIWYLSPRGRRAIEPLLGSIPGSEILTQEDRKRLRIPVGREWGDAMVAAHPGVMYWPDYFHVTDHKIVGMHGYIDKSEEGLGMGILAGNGIRRGYAGKRPLVDVFPTLCDLLDLPVPATNEGVSLSGKKLVVMR